jgi:hypothetical protein
MRNRDSKGAARPLWYRLLMGLSPLLFLGSCAGLVPIGMRLADPMTLSPLGSASQAPFPVLVVAGRDSHVLWLKVGETPPPPPGATYLVPLETTTEITAALQKSEGPQAEGTWILNAEPLAADRQRIELYWLADGYSGGIYEATATAVRPLARKLTGPGFVFVGAGVALGLNVVLWGLIFALARRWSGGRGRSN